MAASAAGRSAGSVLSAWLSQEFRISRARDQSPGSGKRRPGRREALNARGRARPFESTWTDHDSLFAARASLDPRGRSRLEFVVPRSVPWFRRRTGSFIGRTASMDGRFTRRQLIKGTLAVSLVPAIPLARRYRVDVPALPWPAANDIVANTTIPVFPDRSFPITGYGAKNDGKTDNTAAIKKAIEACTAAGGGHVIVPAGSFLTGAIHLKSNVDLHLEKGAVLKFGGDASKFPNVLTRYE